MSNCCQIPSMKKFFILQSFFYLFALYPPSILAQPDLNTEKVDRNVVYRMCAGLALLLDVYYPKKPNGYGFINISGSGWTRPLSSDKPMLNHQGHVQLEGEALVAAGFSLFSVYHRAVPRFINLAAVEDVQRAVRFIRYNAGRYDINAVRIGAVGGSSGGHLVRMLGVFDGDKILEDETPVNKESAKVQCVIARAAPSDFMDGTLGASFIGVGGKVIKDVSSIEHKHVKDASPITHISSDDPPSLLVHGDKDEIVPFALSEAMHQKLRELGIATKLIKMKEAGHGHSFPGVINTPDLKIEYV